MTNDWRDKYDWVWPFSFYTHLGRTYAKVELNGKYGLVDASGKEVLPANYDYVGGFNDGVGDFNDGLAKVKLNGKYGLVDTTGEKIIPPKYDVIWRFFEGFAKVTLDDKYGFVDQQGKEVVPLKYNEAGAFHEGFAKVTLDGQWGLVDTTGNEYWNMSLAEAREQMKNRKIVGNIVSEDKSMSEVKKEASSSEPIPRFDLTAELVRFDKLKKDGLITAEDYEVLKKRAIEKAMK